MTAKRLAFRQADVSRALKGAKAAGFDVGKIEIGQDGSIAILSKGSIAVETADPLEKWEEGYRARKA